MTRFILGFLFIVAAGGILYSQFPVAYYLQPKQDRLFEQWQKDIQAFSKNKEFAGVFEKVGKVEVHFADPQVAAEFERFHTPFKPIEGQPFILRISVIRWIEKSEYGFVVQHELFDETNDKFYEFGRTYKIGLIL